MWFRFVKSRGGGIETVSQIIMNYESVYPIKFSKKSLNFLNDVVGAVRQNQENNLQIFSANHLLSKK